MYMAKPRRSSSQLSLLLLMFVSVSTAAAVNSTPQQMQAADGIALGRGPGGILVGGRTMVEDVKTNKEVQELGKYCVEQYNRYTSRNLSSGSSSRSKPAVVFVKVVEAERQVVSGIMYYLKISAVSASGSSSSGVPRIFNAVVVVKPWADSKEMLSFSPSSSSHK